MEKLSNERTDAEAVGMALQPAELNTDDGYGKTTFTEPANDQAGPRPAGECRPDVGD